MTATARAGYRPGLPRHSHQDLRSARLVETGEAPKFGQMGRSSPIKTHLGLGLGEVRIHDGYESDVAAKEIGARAYTIGRNIFFARGKYRPGTVEGRRLIAHEVAHVAQQRGSLTAHRQSVGPVDSPAEREAAAFADRVVRGEIPPPVRQTVPAGTIQRQVDDTQPTPDPDPFGASDWVPRQLHAFVESQQSVPRRSLGFGGYTWTPEPLGASSHLEHFCSTPAPYALRFRYYVDSAERPRPQPFESPNVSITLEFTPDGEGRAPRSVTVNDDQAHYRGPGQALATRFGETVSIRGDGGGQLAVFAGLIDPSSGAQFTYIDRVRCVLVPCA